MATMLILNSKGPLVASLQQALNAQFGQKLAVDAHFGPRTQAAVLSYNASIGFRNKPYADDATLSALGVTPSAFKTPTNSTSWSSTFGGSGYGSGSAPSATAQSWAEIWAAAPSKVRVEDAAPASGPPATASLLPGVPMLAIAAIGLAGVAWWMWSR